MQSINEQRPVPTTFDTCQHDQQRRTSSVTHTIMNQHSATTRNPHQHQSFQLEYEHLQNSDGNNDDDVDYQIGAHVHDFGFHDHTSDQQDELPSCTSFDLSTADSMCTDDDDDDDGRSGVDDDCFNDFLQDVLGHDHQHDPHFETFINTDFQAIQHTNDDDSTNDIVNDKAPTQRSKLHQEWWNYGEFPDELTDEVLMDRSYPNIIVQSNWRTIRRFQQGQGKSEPIPQQPPNLDHIFGPVEVDCKNLDLFGTFDNYTIIRQEGQDGLHQKYLCSYNDTTTSTQQLKTVTFVPINTQGHTTMSLCVLREKLLLAQELSHPNILQTEELIRLPNSIAVVKPAGYITLRQYMDQVLPKVQNGNTHSFNKMIREVGAALLSALSLLHSNGILHLALNPADILVQQGVHPHQLRRQHIKLANIGNCYCGKKDGSRIVPVTVGCGVSPGYYSPDLLIAPMQCDGRLADVWSVGAVMLDMAIDFDDEWFEAHQMIKLHGTSRPLTRLLNHLMASCDPELDIIFRLMAPPTDFLPVYAHEVLRHPSFR